MRNAENLPQPEFPGQHETPEAQSPPDGLTRLAFGRVNDAVRLLARIGELDDRTISSLDLYCVSEIRQTKEGCLEIKFYDRIKAFELLARCGGQDINPAANSFYAALESAAKSACDSDAV